jgi:hypothetical protein
MHSDTRRYLSVRATQAGRERKHLDLEQRDPLLDVIAEGACLLHAQKVLRPCDAELWPGELEASRVDDGDSEHANSGDIASGVSFDLLSIGHSLAAPGRKPAGRVAEGTC